MSFADWMNESKYRYREEPPVPATKKSIETLLEGIENCLTWLWFSRLGGSTYTTELADEEVHFFVDSRHDLKRAQNGFREAPVLEWLMRGVSSGVVFWDIGAFHGTFSILAAVKGARTIAFEPSVENMERLTRNASLNEVQINCRALALSDRETFQPFGAIDTPGSELAIHEDGEQSIETVRGDTISPKPNIVKLDVEGHELAVLEGMAETLNSVSRIAVEVHRGLDPEEVDQQLQSAGLETAELETNRSETYIIGKR